MKIKTSELIGSTLEWFVSTLEDLHPYIVIRENRKSVWIDNYNMSNHTTQWGWAGPIIEREVIRINSYNAGTSWIADMGDKSFEGKTPLIAAMRCYVFSKFGDEVEIPEELINTVNIPVNGVLS